MSGTLNCPDAAGSINNSANPIPKAYVPPDICIGTFSLTDPDCVDSTNTYQEQLAAENLNVSGAVLNVFKLLGVHEQGKLIDLTGAGVPIGNSSVINAFDALAGEYTSTEAGISVLQAPSYIGYDFGARRTSYGEPESVPDIPILQHITSLRIQQGTVPSTRASQIRVERSDGDYSLNPESIQFSGTGNGSLGLFRAGFKSSAGTFTAISIDANTFQIWFTDLRGTEILGVGTVGSQFNAGQGSFTITAGSVPFSPGDMFTAPIELQWFRVDVVNLPDIAVPALIRITQSKPSRYWRIVPTAFIGALIGASWMIQKLEFFDFEQTRLDDIQDRLLLENRDRDYAKTSLQIKAAYQPFDTMMDMGKFGFMVTDMYTFTTTYGSMVQMLGRPIVVGDVIEVPNELQYDHNLRPVRKFLEVSDVGWSATGYTTAWKPILYRFQAQALIPSQETRDILGTVDTQKYTIDDDLFFAGIEQIETLPLSASKANDAEAQIAVPRKGTNTRESASGTNRFDTPGTYDGVGPYTENGLPPNAETYNTGFKMPDVSSAVDGSYFRLEYEPQLNIPARLYKFSSIKNKFIYVSTDKRGNRSSHKPSQLEIFNLEKQQSLTTVVK